MEQIFEHLIRQIGVHKHNSSFRNWNILPYLCRVPYLWTYPPVPPVVPLIIESLERAPAKQPILISWRPAKSCHWVETSCATSVLMTAYFDRAERLFGTWGTAAISTLAILQQASPHCELGRSWWTFPPSSHRCPSSTVLLILFRMTLANTCRLRAKADRAMSSTSLFFYGKTVLLVFYTDETLHTNELRVKGSVSMLTALAGGCSGVLVRLCWVMSWCCTITHQRDVESRKGGRSSLFKILFYRLSA